MLEQVVDGSLKLVESISDLGTSLGDNLRKRTLFLRGADSFHRIDAIFKYPKLLNFFLDLFLALDSPWVNFSENDVFFEALDVKVVVSY